MPKYAIPFTRKVTQVDLFTRTIEAPTADEAVAYAQSLGDAFDKDCPDDAAQEGILECGDWTACGFFETPKVQPEDAEADHVMPEGWEA